MREGHGSPARRKGGEGARAARTWQKEIKFSQGKREMKEVAKEADCYTDYDKKSRQEFSVKIYNDGGHNYGEES